ncbi:MAG: UvrB/UvrC motif-containing protein [Firmicutes bacterium]|jgi:protein arginine kinase activator|nr:UvrB/UvrC motif-containing protein [Bacillota bacterium]
MLCEECGKRPATVHVQKIVNGRRSEKHICQECAAAGGEMSIFLQPFSVNSLLSAMLGSGAPELRAVSPGRAARCPGCGLGYDDFARTGKLGCGRCYEKFSKPLEGLLRRIHGSDRHVGKFPGKAGRGAAARRELEELKAELARAIQAEEYEKAASIRDRIREIEKAVNR